MIVTEKHLDDQLEYSIKHKPVLSLPVVSAPLGGALLESHCLQCQKNLLVLPLDYPVLVLPKANDKKKSVPITR